jgi:hypothetical protein
MKHVLQIDALFEEVAHAETVHDITNKISTNIRQHLCEALSLTS